MTTATGTPTTTASTTGTAGPAVTRSCPVRAWPREWAREWARFLDWCTATGHTPLPATTDTVLTYLTQENPTRGSAGRWVAAIRAHHHHAGHPDPCRGPVTTWLRRTRTGQPAHLDAVLTDLRPHAAALPAYGWPTGLFGRRDRLALLLHHLAALPAHALAALAATDLTITAPRCLTVTTPTGALDLPAVEDPVLCPACAALRWRWALHHAADYNHRGLAATLATTEPAAQTPTHLCDHVTHPLPGGPPDWPLLPAITRWGHTPLPPVPAMTTRAVQALLRRLEDAHQQRPTLPSHHQTRPPAAPDHPPRPNSSPPAPPPTRADWHHHGLTARTRTHHDLETLTTQWDQVDDVIDHLTHRTRQLLDELADNHSD